MKDILLPFGFKDRNLVHISEAQRGLECGCVCPVCGGRLVARKGSVVAPHFAHYEGAECAKATETALHREAKRILDERREIRLPAVAIPLGSCGPSVPLSPDMTFALDEVHAECRTGDIVPDILAYCRRVALMIEIRVTHEVDEGKLEKIRQLRISTIEIDLSSVCREFSAERLRDAVICQTANKQWLFNAKSEELTQRFLQTAERKWIVSRGLAIHVDDCPLRKRTRDGKPYANLVDDCSECSFLWEVGEENRYVLCGARHKATTLAGLRAFESQRGTRLGRDLG